MFNTRYSKSYPDSINLPSGPSVTQLMLFKSEQYTFRTRTRCLRPLRAASLSTPRFLQHETSTKSEVRKS